MLVAFALAPFGVVHVPVVGGRAPLLDAPWDNRAPRPTSSRVTFCARPQFTAQEMPPRQKTKKLKRYRSLQAPCRSSPATAPAAPGRPQRQALPQRDRPGSALPAAMAEVSFSSLGTGIWVSGSAIASSGLRTTNGGKAWQRVVLPGSSTPEIPFNTIEFATPTHGLVGGTLTAGWVSCLSVVREFLERRQRREVVGSYRLPRDRARRHGARRRQGLRAIAD